MRISPAIAPRCRSMGDVSMSVVDRDSAAKLLTRDEGEADRN
jgi:hypothetical protein